MALKLTKSVVAKRLMSSAAEPSRYVSPISELGEFLSVIDDLNDQKCLHPLLSMLTGQIAHKVSPFEQRLLVWSGQFKKKVDVPHLVS